MKYEVLFELEYYNGSLDSKIVTFETFGKNKKVLKAYLKKYIEYFYTAIEKIYDVRIEYIKRYESLRPNNVWNKKEFEKYKNKLYKINYVVH
jgi:hypothetical protein